jgi:hypothetical protein
MKEPISASTSATETPLRENAEAEDVRLICTVNSTLSDGVDVF